MNVSEDELANLPGTAEVLWERTNRKFWPWIGKVQQVGIKSQLEGNVFTSDHLRLEVMASLLLAGKDKPDVILLQEVGLSRLTSDDYPTSVQDETGKKADFSSRL